MQESLPYSEFPDEQGETLKRAKELLTDPKEDIERVVRGDEPRNTGPQKLVEEARHVVDELGRRDVGLAIARLREVIAHGDIIAQLQEEAEWTPKESERYLDAILEALEAYRSESNAELQADEQYREIKSDGTKGGVHSALATFPVFASSYLSNHYGKQFTSEVMKLVRPLANDLTAFLRSEYGFDDPNIMGSEDES
jgi:hypothetical protein